jgi:hypothetical protein
MCTEVCIGPFKGGTYCESIGQLRAAGFEPVQVDYGKLHGTKPWEFSPNECLCHVDHTATAKRYGYRVSRSDPMTVRYYRPRRVTGASTSDAACREPGGRNAPGTGGAGSTDVCSPTITRS